MIENKNKRKIFFLLKDCKYCWNVNNKRVGKMTIPGNGLRSKVIEKNIPERIIFFLKKYKVASIKKTVVGSGKIVLE